MLLLLSPALKSGIVGHHFAYNLSLAEAAREFFGGVRILAARTYTGPDCGCIDAVVKRPDFSALKTALRRLPGLGADTPDRPVLTAPEDAPYFERSLLHTLWRGVKGSHLALFYAAHILRLLRRYRDTRAHVMVEDAGFWELAALPLLLRCAGRHGPAAWHLLLRHPPESFVEVFASPRDLRRRLRRLCGNTPVPVYLYTDTEQLSDAYRQFTGCVEQFVSLPVPVIRTIARSLQRDGGRLRIGCMGGPRVDKGFPALPLLYGSLPARIAGLEATLVIQTGPQVEQGTRDAVRELEILSSVSSSGRPGLELFAEPDTEAYAEKFAGLDVLLLLYTGRRYRFSSSGVFVEAVQCGTPVLTYAGSWADGIMREAAAQGLRIGLSVRRLSDVPAALERMAGDLALFRKDLSVYGNRWLPEHDMRMTAAAVARRTGLPPAGR
jgi:hypothetical protein